MIYNWKYKQFLNTLNRNIEKKIRFTKQNKKKRIYIGLNGSI